MSVLKQTVNRYLADPTVTKTQREILCKFVDDILGTYKKDRSCFVYRELSENETTRTLWKRLQEKGSPVKLEDILLDPTKREYY